MKIKVICISLDCSRPRIPGFLTYVQEFFLFPFLQVCVFFFKFAFEKIKNV